MDAERWEELLINYQNDPDQLVFYWSGSFWWFCWLLTGTKARWITHHTHCRQVLIHTLFHRQLINTDRGRGRTKDILLRLTRPPDLTAPPTPPSWQRIIARQRPETRNTFNQHTHTHTHDLVVTSFPVGTHGFLPWPVWQRRPLSNENRLES